MTTALPSRRARAAWLAFPLALGLLLLAFSLSVSVGARDIPLAEVWRLLFRPDGSTESLIVQTLRLPRRVAALAVSGAMLQGITRNPLAGPGHRGQRRRLVPGHRGAGGEPGARRPREVPARWAVTGLERAFGGPLVGIRNSKSRPG